MLIHAVILPLILLLLHSKDTDPAWSPTPSPPPGMAPPYEGNIHAISHVTEAVADLWHFQLRGGLGWETRGEGDEGAKWITPKTQK